MRRIAVIGLGLMGGSIGLAIRSRKLPWEVVGYTRSASRGQQALRRQAIDRLCASPADAVKEADLAVFCAPVQAIPQLIREARRGFASGAIVTDVGSTRAFLDAEVPPLLEGTGAVFVGSHPIAGSEQQGIDAARADLYAGARVLVTPAANTPARALSRVRRFWKQLGARVTLVDSREHDRLLARTSHLPHMVATLLALTVGRTAGREVLADYCGTGFADTSRVAEGAPEVWLDIVRTNRSNLSEELRAYRAQLDRLLAMLDDGDFEGVRGMLENGRLARRQLLAGRKAKRT